MKIYLAGKIAKGEEIKTYVDWREEYSVIFGKYFPKLEIFNPDNTEANGVVSEKDSMFWFGHDCWMIKSASVIVVNAEQKLGVGTSQEIMIAKYFNKPVITVLPKETHHRRNLNLKTGYVEDWIHPFIKATSDLIVEKVEDAVEWIKQMDIQKIKTLNTIDISIDYYQSIMRENQGKEKQKRFI